MCDPFGFAAVVRPPGPIGSPVLQVRRLEQVHDGASATRCLLGEAKVCGEILLMRLLHAPVFNEDLRDGDCDNRAIRECRLVVRDLFTRVGEWVSGPSR